VNSNEAWRSLSKDYEAARGRHDSLDRLLEWEAQRHLMGTIEVFSPGASLEVE
jgi:hypothetical protein